MTYHAYPVLIGLGGRKTAGKDAVADTLTLASDVVKLGMSDALHECLLILDPWVVIQDDLTLPALDGTPATLLSASSYRYADLDEWFGFVEMKRIPEVRRLQQTFGTEVGREKISLSIWTDMTAAKIREHLAAGRTVIVTGMRFPNELWMLRDLGGISIWVNRPGLETTDTHASEGSVSAADFDVVIENDGTLDDLRLQTLLTVETVLTLRDAKIGHVPTEEHKPAHRAEPTGSPA